MGFYDNVDLTRFNFISKIRTNPQVAEPSPEFMNAIDEHKNSSKNLVIAEIGVGFGASTLLACQKLSAGDVYYCFDFQNSIVALLEDLKKFPDLKCAVVGVGNSHKAWDSYNWNLSSMLLDMRLQNLDGWFDVCYLDGAHTFLHDGLAVCMLKEMIKPNGILILDDLFWTYASSPIVSEFGKEQFPEDQWKARQVLRVQDIFLINDPKFKRLSDSESWRGVFKRIN